ncbi:molybdopterin-binding protein [Candidatus Epulonipiscium viviparus]|uniref:molybdopterin-binding protein n=1 Tax=Candidatus Epulonipiscium viviparus TaxID=420336 RepID=UPI0027381258|nr:molybdopterin-binding protein [Candidatus Epulopiscium viviparus]
MKKIPVAEAVGSILCHDITQIIQDVTKQAIFRKGHVIAAEDVPVLLSLGKENIYVWEADETMMHENDAAEILYGFCHNEGIAKSEVKEGKIEAIATRDGCLKVDTTRLLNLNLVEEIMIATIHSNRFVKQGEKLAGMRVIPLAIAKDKMESLAKMVGETPLLNLIPFNRKKVGIVTTGSEIFKGRITDKFGPVIREKLAPFGCEILGQTITDDKVADIVSAIKAYIEMGADMVVCTGGMSVDPDDVTPSAIREVGAEVISYGAPVLPGAMFLLSYLDGKPILGLPGCVMYSKATIFDLVLPRIMIDERLTKLDLAILGHGGFCNSCSTCNYPSCAFGK